MAQEIYDLLEPLSGRQVGLVLLAASIVAAVVFYVWLRQPPDH